MTTQGNRLFAVADASGQKQFFDLKGTAKLYRNSLIVGGFKAAHVTYGPDHPNHKAMRRHAGWNKGRHPKANWQGKSKQVKKF